jgi:putative phage-type endonuclease
VFDSTILEKITEDALCVIYKHIIPPRSSGVTFIRIKNKGNRKKMINKINYLQSVPQPEQRTSEWYAFRYNHLTASNIWKAFISESTRNQLIFEKCQPLAVEKSTNVNLESPLHWGQKYEPLSVKVYEKLYDTKVSDFGCIPHKTIAFLAASPDGINTAERSMRFGRMLEIKNIFNREITGIPKLEYWVQIQLQLEVCDLNECDFLETRFIEYPDEETYKACPSQQKGLIMLFMKGNGQPVYEYAPLIFEKALTFEKDEKDKMNIHQQWQEEMMEKNKEYTWIKNIYWKLDQFSCILVLRNKLWFTAALPQLHELWKTIETEKQTGEYIKRAPRKNSSTVKVKKLPANESMCSIEMPTKCFITI